MVNSTEIKITERMPLEKAMKIMKKKMAKEGIFKDIKLRRAFEKPSARDKRKRKEAALRKKKTKNNNRRRG